MWFNFFKATSNIDSYLPELIIITSCSAAICVCAISSSIVTCLLRSSESPSEEYYEQIEEAVQQHFSQNEVANTNITHRRHSAPSN